MSENAAPELDPQLRKRARIAALKYGGARLALFIVLTFVIWGLSIAIGATIPLVVAALLALIVALPLSMLIFTGMRRDANEAIAAWSENRRARKQWVRDELAGR